jgi:hypothetical protein
MAESRTQKDWDVKTPDGETVQVRYLANRTDDWKNWHWVASNRNRWDWYALVVFEDLSPTTLYMFPSEDLSDICSALKKRHKGQEKYLSFTGGNHKAMREDPDRFRELGVVIVDLTRTSDWVVLVQPLVADGVLAPRSMLC